jgi:hypothetical protein
MRRGSGKVPRTGSVLIGLAIARTSAARRSPTPADEVHCFGRIKYAAQPEGGSFALVAATQTGPNLTQKLPQTC